MTGYVRFTKYTHNAIIHSGSGSLLKCTDSRASEVLPISSYAYRSCTAEWQKISYHMLQARSRRVVVNLRNVWAKHAHAGRRLFFGSLTPNGFCNTKISPSIILLHIGSLVPQILRHILCHRTLGATGGGFSDKFGGH